MCYSVHFFFREPPRPDIPPGFLLMPTPLMPDPILILEPMAELPASSLTSLTSSLPFWFYSSSTSSFISASSSSAFWALLSSLLWISFFFPYGYFTGLFSILAAYCGGAIVARFNPTLSGPVIRFFSGASAFWFYFGSMIAISMRWSYLFKIAIAKSWISSKTWRLSLFLFPSKASSLFFSIWFLFTDGS